MDTDTLSGTREFTDDENDPHNALAQFIEQAELDDAITHEQAAEARHLLAAIGSDTEEASPDQIERLKQTLEDVDPSAADLIDDLLNFDAPASL